jgi:hypothetical protein
MRKGRAQSQSPIGKGSTNEVVRANRLNGRLPDGEGMLS